MSVLQAMTLDCKTILIVEDEALVRFDLADFFGEAGWQVFEASNADEAITLLDAHSDIQAVVTDVQMPGSMDGVKLAHHIRDRHPPTILFVVSGHRCVPDADLPSETSFVAKPFDPHRLLSRIEHARC